MLNRSVPRFKSSNQRLRDRFTVPVYGLLPAVALVLAGCQVSSNPDPQESLEEESAPLSNLDIARSSGGEPGVGDSALLEGTLVEADGCLAVEPDYSGPAVIPVFDTADTRPESLSIGDHVSLSGGFVSSQQSFEIPKNCEGKDEYFLVVIDNSQ